MTHLARLVETTMEDQGLTLREVAERSGLSLSTVGAYKTGQITGARSNRGRLTQLATGLGLPVDDVLQVATASGEGNDAATMLELFRRLPAEERALAVEVLRVHVRYARERAALSRR